MKKALVTATAVVVGCLGTFHASPALATSFQQGSLIIPMDTDYQDAGMLTAFGLLDKLLRAGVTVNWIIDPTKTCSVTSMTGKVTTYTCTPADMTATATDFKTGTVVAGHGYRGGPFVIDSSLAATATPIILAWQAANTNVKTFTAVHVASASFDAPVSRVLTAAPRIAVLNDTNQDIAFGYLNAALIPDEKGNAWSNSSPDLLTDVAVGGSSTDPQDGVLFGGVSGGQPQYCEIMTMHWNVGTSTIPAVVAEMGSFLHYPVHVNAECQAVNAVEGEPPDGGLADFVTTAGFQWPAPAQPTYVQFSNSALPFAQIDGPFQTTGGSEPAYALATGSAYYNQDIVMLKGAGVGVGVQDLWMTGYPKGACDIVESGCKGIGKVSYLGGHKYDSTTPITQDPMSQGARLFLNSLYEAGCVTSDGQPSISLTKSAPAATLTPDVTFTIDYLNFGYGAALGFILTDPLPAGTTFVSATNGGTFANGTVTWNLGDVGKNADGEVSVTVALPGKGTYLNQASSTYKVGLNVQSTTSNQTTTVWGDCVTGNDCPSGQSCLNGECTDLDGGSSSGGSADSGAADAGAGGGADSGTGADSGASSSGGGDATVDDASASGSGGGDATASDATTSSGGGDGSSSGASSSGTSGSGSGTGSGSSSGGSGSGGASGSGAGSGGTSGSGAGTSGSGADASAGCGCSTVGTSTDDADLGILSGLAFAVFAARRKWRRMAP